MHTHCCVPSCPRLGPMGPAACTRRASSGPHLSFAFAREGGRGLVGGANHTNVMCVLLCPPPLAPPRAASSRTLVPLGSLIARPSSCERIPASRAFFPPLPLTRTTRALPVTRTALDEAVRAMAFGLMICREAAALSMSKKGLVEEVVKNNWYLFGRATI